MSINQNLKTAIKQTPVLSDHYKNILLQYSDSLPEESAEEILQMINKVEFEMTDAIDTFIVRNQLN